MSATTHAERQCTYCSETYSVGYDAQYCSEVCYWKERGASVIRQIQNDHRFCTSCYARRKHIDKPPEEFRRKLKAENGYESAESVVGFQYHTPAVKRDHGFIYCKCGNIDHYADIEELRDIDRKDVIVNLWSLLVEYYHDNQFGENTPDKDVLFDTLKESEFDFEYAIGKAVYSE